jgi:arylsulfatase
MWQVRMELHAAMIDRMDQEIGRVLEQLRSMNALDDTLVMFMSDNGASAEKLVRGDGNDPTAPPGSAKTFLCIEPPWANVANAPLRLSKMFVHEGGIATPLVVRWPRGFAGQNQLRHQPSHFIDIVPTIFDILGAGTPEPSSAAQPPLPGKSLLPVLVADKPIERDYLWWFHERHRAVRIGDLKLVSLDEDEPWELYDLKADRAETHDLASAQPDKVRELAAVWKAKLDEFTRQAASK